MGRCVSCSVSEGGSSVSRGKSRRGTRPALGTWHKTITCSDVHERLFSLSRRKKCCCQAVGINADEEASKDDNCTFKPTVNRTHDTLLLRWAEGADVFERLYGNALFLQKKRKLLRRSSVFYKSSQRSNYCNSSSVSKLKGLRSFALSSCTSSSSSSSLPSSSLLLSSSSLPVMHQHFVERRASSRMPTAGKVAKRTTLISPFLCQHDVNSNSSFRTRTTTHSRGCQSYGKYGTSAKY